MEDHLGAIATVVGLILLLLFGTYFFYQYAPGILGVEKAEIFKYPHDLPITTLLRGSNSGEQTRNTYAFWTENDWNNVKNTLSVSVPPVDFNTVTLLAAFAGSKHTGGFSIAIDSVVEWKNTVRVHVTEFVPDSGCVVSQGFTEPFSLVTIPKIMKTVEFSIDTKRTACE